MILPFLSFTWGSYGGKYAMPFARILCDWTTTNPGRYAAQQLNARAKGRRMLLFQNAEVTGRLFTHPSDRIAGGRNALWFTNGVAATAAQFGGIIEQMYLNKADLDFATFDMEAGPSSWIFSEDDLAAIHADPRYAACVATGYFPADCRNMNAANRTLFNYGCTQIINTALYNALIKPLYKRYPGVGWCNFSDSPCTKADAPLAPDLNNNPQYISPSAATHYAPSMYGHVGNLGFDPRFKQPFYCLAWTTNCVKAVYRSKTNAKLMPWLAPRVTSNVFDAAHWQENIFHACCLAGPGLLYFNNDDPSALANWRFDNAISQYVGQSRGKIWQQTLSTDLTQFNSATYVMSAAKLSDASTVGRVTFKPGVNSATFTVGGKKYTAYRPGGAVGAWFHS